MKRESAKPMNERTTGSIMRYLLCRLNDEAKNLDNNDEFDNALHDAIRSLNVLTNFY